MPKTSVRLVTPGIRYVEVPDMERVDVVRVAQVEGNKRIRCWTSNSMPRKFTASALGIAVTVSAVRDDWFRGESLPVDSVGKCQLPSLATCKQQSTLSLSESARGWLAGYLCECIYTLSLSESARGWLAIYVSVFTQYTCSKQS